MALATAPADPHPPIPRLAVFVIVLGVLVALGSFTIDMYLPAFPAIRDEFDVAVVTVQLTLTATTVGFGTGQFFVGPLSDRIGRRLPMLASTGVHVAASALVALAPDITTLMIGRFLQGFGAAAGSVVALAIIRDLFAGRSLVLILSRMALVTGLAPIIAPIVGAQLLAFMPWRGLFVVLGVYGMVALAAAAFVIPETNGPARRRAAPARGQWSRYRALLTDRVYIAVALIGGLIGAGAFAYVSSASFLLQSTYGLSADGFSIVFAINALFMLGGVQVGAWLARRGRPAHVLRLSCILLVLTAIAVLVLPMVTGQFWALVVPLALFMGSFGMGSPCISVLALDPHPNEAGTAAALLGAFNFIAVGCISPLPGFIGEGSAGALGAVLISTSVIAFLITVWMLRPGQVKPLTV